MAYDISIINGVTKETFGDGHKYSFEDMVITTNTAGDYFVRSDRGESDSRQITFQEITNKNGTANVEEYCDYLCTIGSFYQGTSIVDIIDNPNTDFSRTYVSTSGGDKLDAQSVGTAYVAYVIRNIDQSANNSKTLRTVFISMMPQTNDDFCFFLARNLPIQNVNNLPPYNQYTNVGIEISVNVGPLDQTVFVDDADFSFDDPYFSTEQRRATDKQLSRVGYEIDDQVLTGSDYIVACVVPYTSNLDFKHSLNFKVK